MKKEKIIILGIFLVFGIFLLSTSSAQSTSYCCEKLVGLSQDAGMWCQNAPSSQCSPLYRSLPTSCEASGFCTPGTCILQSEGLCTANTPQRVCDANGGYWREESIDELPQCQLGCCFLGDQVAFVTQTRCGSLASEYGLEANFRGDITSELECITSSSPEVKGACAYDASGVRDCQMLTKRECNELDAGGSYENVMFHEGFLCSAPELNTVCDPRGGTTCVEGKDEVYFLDTCGNVANVYNSDKLEDLSYWTYLVGEDNVEVDCGPVTGRDGGTALQEKCGECSYFEGSTCTKKSFGDNVDPVYGDNYCRSLDCTQGFDTNRDGVIDPNSEEKSYKHGESWCVVSSPDDNGKYYTNNLITVANGGTSFNNQILGEATIRGEVIDNPELTGTTDFDPGIAISQDSYNAWKKILTEEFNLPGTRYYRALCFNGEVLIEPCADFRQEICMQSTTEDSTGEVFRNAACKINAWEDCMEQTDEIHCEDRSSRDCIWLPIMSQKQKWDEGDRITVGDPDAHVCVPAFGPGFATWKEENDADLVCGRAAGECITTVKRWGLQNTGEKRIAWGRECIPDGTKLYGVKTNEGTGEWRESKDIMTWFLGDCGEKENYMGKQGADLGDVFGTDRAPWKSDLY